MCWNWKKNNSGAKGLKSILILSLHLRLGNQICPLPSRFLNKFMYFFLPHACNMTCLYHPPWFDPPPTISDQKYKSHSSLRNFLKPPVQSIAAAFWPPSKCICRPSTINSSPFDSTVWINLPLRGRLLPNEDNLTKIPKPSDRWTFKTLPSMMPNYEPSSSNREISSVMYQLRNRKVYETRLLITVNCLSLKRSIFNKWTNCTFVFYFNTRTVHILLFSTMNQQTHN